MADNGRGILAPAATELCNGVLLTAGEAGRLCSGAVKGHECKSLRHIGQSAQRRNQGVTHAAQNVWLQGKRTGCCIGCPRPSKQMEHSSSRCVCEQVQRRMALSVSACVKPHATFRSPWLSSTDMRPSKTEVVLRADRTALLGRFVLGLAKEARLHSAA